MPHEVSTGTLTVERLRWLLDYDPETGIFRWKNRDNRPDFIGRVAGCVSRLHGYRVIRIDGFLYKAGRLAWLYCTGQWPSQLIDHADGRRDNDAFANLREASSHQNCSNKAYVSSISGFKGVFWNARRQRFVARITVNRKSVYLGTFKCPREAASAYNVGAVLLVGKFARINQI